MVSLELKVKRRRLMPDNLIKSGNSFPISEFEVNVNGNGKTSHKVTEQGRLSIRTACDPKQFKETVVALTSKRSKSLIERIIGMGEFNGSTVKVTKKCSDGTKKGSAGESDNVSTSLHSPISEDIKAMSEICGVKSDVPRVSSLLDCLESKLCILRNKICEVEQLVVVMKVGVIECIVSDVIEAVKSMMADTIDHGALDSKEEIDAHDCGTVIGRETFPRQLTSLMHKPSDGRWKKPLDEEFEPKEARKNKNRFRFPLSKNLSRKDLKMLKFLFSKGRKGVDKSRVEVVRFGEIGLSHSDFQCLLPTIPLSSKVINIFAAYLSEEHSNSWFLPTYFGKRASSKDDTSNVHASLVFTIKECGLHRFNRRLKRCCQIFVPLHDEIAEHWFMLVMKLHEKVAQIWDSQRDNGSSYRRHEKARSAMSLLLKVFSNDMTKRGDVYYNFESFPVTFPDVCPSIYKNFDSGIYIIRQMQRYPLEWFEGFNSSEQRTLIALEIVNNLTNEVVKSVNAKAEDHRGCYCFGDGMFKPPNHMPSNNDPLKDCGIPTMNCVDNPPTGRKCRSHRKRRAAVLAL